MAYVPEQRLEPPRPPEPDCICLCGDCLEDEIRTLSIRELAELIDADRFTAEEIRDERRENS